MANKIIKIIDDYKKVSELAGLGFSVKSIAAYLGMSKATFDRRVSEDEDLKLALDRGRAKAYELVANTAYKMATSGNHPSMTQFWLKCREGWSDREGDTLEQSQIVISYELFDEFKNQKSR